MKMECDVIRDLLPLYVEKLTSGTSNKLIEEHLEQCEECSEVYEKMRAPKPSVRYGKEAAESFQNYVKKEKKKLALKSALITAAFSVAVAVVIWIAAFAFFVWNLKGIMKSPKMEDTDVSHYSWYMGENAKKEYRDKMNMDESIFPEEITGDMKVSDYKMVYYNPWDPQFLSYLVVDYDEASYQEEVARLAEYDSEEYRGLYGAEGFQEGYTLLAMETDDSYGMVYALSEQDCQIIYVELIFCNYFYDLDYWELIPKEYLPTGFDATEGNLYRQQKLK